ncbi:MAG TPA: VOC family protein [Sphingomonadaceae bacterium]|nr:VOC family protein [Sphingomonadaceae bacterium]
MATANGWPIWYELMTRDPRIIAPFYKEVIGWTIPAEGMTMPNGANYRQIERADGGHEGGVLAFDQGMIDAGMQPMWATYFCVDDVDATIAKATGLGARIHMSATTVPGAGRMAMLSDPQGAMFYLIAPQPPEGMEDYESGVFSVDRVGCARWNELSTPDDIGAVAFYGALFGWNTDSSMDMGPMGQYRFIELAGEQIGAISPVLADGVPPNWLPYFRVADIRAARAAILAHGGSVVMDVHEVPGDEEIVIATDPDGAAVGFVAAKAG